jgi:DinB superfamily
MSDTELRKQLVSQLKGDQAHMSLEEAVADFPIEQINTRPDHVEYTVWHLIEHVRITQRDLLDYITRTDYKEGDWPADYWPAPDATTDQAGWQQSVADFLADRQMLINIAENSATDLFAGVPTHADHTILRCLLVVGNHNSYHIGELGSLRATAQTWGPSHTA